jgi:hypothetical protein
MRYDLVPSHAQIKVPSHVNPDTKYKNQHPGTSLGDREFIGISSRDVGQEIFSYKIHQI